MLFSSMLEEEGEDGRKGAVHRTSWLDRQIKGSTMRVARANEKGKQNMTAGPSLGCKSYFGTEAVVLRLHALRLSTRFY